MSRWKIEIEEKPNPTDLRYVIGKLEAFNEAHTPTAFLRKDVRLFVRDEAGTIQAALLGTVTMHSLVIQIMWVDEALRRQGVGKELVASAEGIARDTGAKQVIVETTTFQAPEFYNKLGFEVICEIPDCPIGAISYLMRKAL
jgi:ribosomal protein S18 acetylase RimI-like enzyme